MTMIDELNVASAEYAKQISDTWSFTGWKPGQGNDRLHAQWLRCDEYEGERYYSSLQCFPLVLGDADRHELAKELMKQALDDVQHLTAPGTNVQWKGTRR
jgi:hypothetical protein